MLLNNNSDTNILFDLEYKGIDSAISSFEHGLRMPKSMVEQVKNIINKNYEIEMEISRKSDKKEDGCFCGVSYKDETMCLLKRSN